jgi:hypothetical protein
MHSINRSALTAILVAFTIAAVMSRAFAQPIGGQVASTQLDGDQNGLYDDVERKALLEVIGQNVPSVKDIKFDADDDGKVTIAEQSQGRLPLTTTIGPELLKSGVKIPWAIDAFPEWISVAYLQEDVSKGDAKVLKPRGLFELNAQATKESKPPKKPAAGRGVEFAANSGQQLSLPGHRNARWDFRWCMITFRVDAGTGTDAETLLFDLNSGESSGRSSPKVWYHMDTGLHVQYVGTNKGGIDKRVIVADNVIADGKTWNVLVCGTRYGQMFASVNGVAFKTEKPQPARFASELPPKEGMTTYIGDPGQGHMAWAFDGIILGLTEPTEAMVHKMSGWAAHRLNFQKNLPSDHPYRHSRPLIDAEDFPTRFVPDEEQWNAIGAKAKDKSITRVNAGGERTDPATLGFERVFYDDFRNYRVAPSYSGEGDLWHGPGWNTGVGGDAPMIAPGRKPDAYQYDRENKQQRLSLAFDGKEWRSAAIFTVNDLGHGYTWNGPKVFRIRCMFATHGDRKHAGGLFPGFWSYDNDFLFWRTANRIEVDYFEFDGYAPNWLNSFSSHYHYSHLRKIPNNLFNPKPEGYKRFKAYGGELTHEKSNIPGGIVIWDGQFHTWEYVIDHDMTYVNVTVADKAGGDRWVEIFRTPTAPTYLERLDLHVTMAMKERYGLPTGREDLVVDWIEVMQKPAQLQALPTAFTERPKLTGTTTVGSTVTCEPNVKGVTDIRYFWFADRYPLTWGPSNTYTITEADVGKQIRCMVKAVGALDAPEAWSNTLR